jgi:hypothetical protein
MANEIAAWLGRSGAVGAATYAPTQLPGTASVVAYGVLGIVTLLVVLSSLPRSKARRDAARETLKMLLDYLRPSNRRSGDASPKNPDDRP